MTSNRLRRELRAVGNVLSFALARAGWRLVATFAILLVVVYLILAAQDAYFDQAIPQPWAP